MKELRMDRFVGLGCVSQSSVAVIAKQTKRPEQPADAAAAAAAAASPALPSGEDGGRRSIVKPRSVSFSRTALSFPRPNVAAGLQKLIRGFRSLSQLFLVDREEEDDDEELEMVIGFPTDVQHVGHIGWDGFDGMAGGSTKGWEKAAGPPEFLPLPSSSSSSSFSLQQFELAMAPAQAGAPRPAHGGRVGVCPE